MTIFFSLTDNLNTYLNTYYWNWLTKFQKYVCTGLFVFSTFILYQDLITVQKNKWNNALQQMLINYKIL